MIIELQDCKKPAIPNYLKSFGDSFIKFKMWKWSYGAAVITNEHENDLFIVPLPHAIDPGVLYSCASINAIQHSWSKTEEKSTAIQVLDA